VFVLTEGPAPYTCVLLDEFNILRRPCFSLPVAGFPLQTPDLDSRPVHFHLVVEEVTLGQIFLKLFHSTVAQWLRNCATNRKVAGSIPAGVIGIFH